MMTSAYFHVISFTQKSRGNSDIETWPARNSDENQLNREFKV